jgi:hypothetical protein
MNKKKMNNNGSDSSVIIICIFVHKTWNYQIGQIQMLEYFRKRLLKITGLERQKTKQICW